MYISTLGYSSYWNISSAFFSSSGLLEKHVNTPKLEKYDRLNILYKGKAVPLQAWSGPEGSRKFRFSDYMTTAQDGGKIVSFTHRPPLPPGNTPGTHFC